MLELREQESILKSLISAFPSVYIVVLVLVFLKLLISEESKSWDKSFISICPSFFTVVIVVVCLNLLISVNNEK